MAWSATGSRPTELSAPPGGLTEQEATDRRASGLGNHAPAPTSRSYRQIIVENVFTFINLLLFGLGLTLAILGRLGDALISTMVILINVAVSVMQEIRAKRTLDRIALLARPLALVVRGGVSRLVPPDQLVVGDMIKVGPGDQFLVDGRVVASNNLTADESLLTGESDMALKSQGDVVYSGTFCVAGEGYYVAEQVGAHSLANQMTANARAFRRVLTPLQREINVVVRLTLLIVVYMEFLLVVTSVLQQINLADSVENAAIVAGLVPNGLFLSIAVAYALGAVRILRYGALTQQANAIESLSHVDVLCLDKTGTLTTNRLHVVGVYPLAVSEEMATRALGALAASVSGGNKTTEALHRAWPSEVYPVASEIPFSSARQWSALAFASDERLAPSLAGVFVLGAPDALTPALSIGAAQSQADVAAIQKQAEALAGQGLRVLLLAHAPQATPAEAGRAEASTLPTALLPWALVALGDELRPEAREALSAFIRAGAQPKIISGDHPQTVATLARQSGFDGATQVVSGRDLDSLSDSEFDTLAETANVFGRITPQQKERLVKALRRRGHYVAMIGDGVNDVLSLKQADVGIAMCSGSSAARGVADVVLMQDSFAVLIPAVQEGQRIVNGMQDILKLFLIRIGTVGMVILSSLVVGTFPLELRQGSLVTFFSVGVPAIALSVWAHPGLVPPGTLMRRLVRFVAPPVILTSAIGLLLFVGSYALRLLQTGTFGSRNLATIAMDYPAAQSLLTSFLVICGLLMVLFVEPPTPWWECDATGEGDRRPTLLVVGLLAIFALITLLPPLRSLFLLAPLGLQEYALLVAAVGIWLATVRASWRSHLLSRYLGVKLDDVAL
jgi:cation-transporting ATPase E